MPQELIDSNVLIDSVWTSYARQSIQDYQGKYFYYIHTSSEPVEIGGGPFGRQTIHPLAITPADEEFLVSSIERLDSLIDLDFERTWLPSEAASRYFLDSQIDVEGNPLGLAVMNSDQDTRWFEILLDGRRLVDLDYRRYASLHEYAHTLGLEHPFDDADGDSAGGTNPWTSNIFPEDTVMAYRRPLLGQWPQWFSASDINALVVTWGLEDDQRGSYQFSSLLSGQPLMLGDSTVAKHKIASGTVVLESFMPAEREVYGSSQDDALHGFSPIGGLDTRMVLYRGR